MIVANQIFCSERSKEHVMQSGLLVDKFPFDAA